MDFIDKIKTNYKAGLTVAIINIPLSISLAVASGATPTQGIITGIWSTIIAAFFASSNYNVFGVAGALTSIILTFVITNGANGTVLLPVVAIVAGLIMLLVYLLKITRYITLIPSSVLHGFLMSVGISIALSQLSGALGLNNPLLSIPTHKEVYLNLYEIYNHFSSIDITSLMTFLIGFSFLAILKKRFPNFPAVIILTILGIIIGILIDKNIVPFDMLLLSEKFKNLSFSLYQLPFSNLSIDSFKEFFNLLKSVFSTALVITIVAILETIISAKIAEKMTKEKFDKDREVLGLSLSNIGTGLLGGIPVTAVFIRTSLNIKSGGNHKISQALTGIFTLIISALLFNDFFKYLPFPIIAAILFNIAVGLIDVAPLKRIFKLEKVAFYITLLTTIISVLEDATYGILIGTSIALLIFIKKVSAGDAYVSIFRKKEFLKKVTLDEYVEEQKEKDILVVNFVGGLSYLNIEPLLISISKLNNKQSVLISFSHLGELDVDGIEGLEEMVEILNERKIDLYFSGVTDKSREIIEKTKFFRKLDKNGKVTNSTSLALKTLLGN